MKRVKNVWLMSSSPVKPMRQPICSCENKRSRPLKQKRVNNKTGGVAGTTTLNTENNLSQYNATTQLSRSGSIAKRDDANDITN